MKMHAVLVILLVCLRTPVSLTASMVTLRALSDWQLEH